jgi:hypothetical protein
LPGFSQKLKIGLLRADLGIPVPDVLGRGLCHPHAEALGQNVELIDRRLRPSLFGCQEDAVAKNAILANQRLEVIVECPSLLPMMTSCLVRVDGVLAHLERGQPLELRGDLVDEPGDVIHQQGTRDTRRGELLLDLDHEPRDDPVSLISQKLREITSGNQTSAGHIHRLALLGAGVPEQEADLAMGRIECMFQQQPNDISARHIQPGCAKLCLALLDTLDEALGKSKRELS